jgi:hypothetical protein
VGGTNYCPTFQVNQTATVPVEGKYGIVVTAADAVNNTSTQKSLIYVDATAPTASLIRNSGTYTTSRALDQNSHHLMLRFTVNDPCIGFTNCSVPGSGVASVSINVKESGGRTINQLPIPAKLSNGVWVADVALPFGDPSGFYQISAITTDNVGNSKEVVVAGENSPIEVDNTPPQDVIASPSPYDANTYFIGNQALTGRVSDYVDGRAAIHQGMRVRLDFEAPDGASVFDNRGDSRYNTSCTICPTVALDTNDPTKRIARFNIDGVNQSLTIANAATVLSGTFGIAMMVKISNGGTILATGVASNPRLRIKAEKVGTTFKLTAQRGTKAISTPATIPANVWFRPAPPDHANNLLFNRSGQNAPAKSAGLTSLPGDPFSDFLWQTGTQNNVRVNSPTALPTQAGGQRATLLQTEHTYGLMVHVSKSLGVNCTFCHNTRSFSSWAESTPQRSTAWYGLRMVRDINGTYLEPLSTTFPEVPVGRLGPGSDWAKVNCATCHRGVNKPLNGSPLAGHYPGLLPPPPTGSTTTAAAEAQPASASLPRP